MKTSLKMRLDRERQVPMRCYSRGTEASFWDPKTSVPFAIPLVESGENPGNLRVHMLKQGTASVVLAIPSNRVLLLKLKKMPTLKQEYGESIKSTLHSNNFGLLVPENDNDAFFHASFE